ncbi:MAG TPA: winged helix-turn-helix domain-containing protein [Pyrinomonadaceae bacterium]|jgi:TolB-like protein/DNA-binding winged helix-turn-helix (wHTH) protein/Tfp pilus assembly protein PilF
MNRHVKHYFEFGPFRLDPAECLLLREGQPVPLTKKAFETLLVLIQYSGYMLEKEELIRMVWQDRFIEEATLAQNIFTLRKALGEDHHERQYIETVPKRGYRFIAKVKEVWENNTETMVGDDGGARILLKDEETGLGGNGIQSLAVLPLVNASADPNIEYFSDGITEGIINSLARLSQLHVIARSTIFRYKGKEVDPQEVGRSLNVHAVLTGRVFHMGQRLIISIELVDVASGWQLWGEQHKIETSDIFEEQEEISKEISEKLRVKLVGADKRLLTRLYAENTEAYQLYLEGRYYWNKRSEEGFKRGLLKFKEAIDLDPNYALAYAGLADCYNLLNGYGILAPEETAPKAKAAALRALEIDDTLTEAYTSLAWVKFVYDWDFAGAEAEFNRAIALNPNYATAHHWYALYLLVIGEKEKSLSEIKRAQKLDPLSLIINTAVATNLYYMGQYDAAIEQCQKTLELNPDFFAAQSMIGMCWQQKGMHDEAIAEFEKALKLSGTDREILAVIGHAYGVAGRRDDALRMLAQLEEQSKQRYVSPVYRALIYTGLGEKDQAFAWLDMAYQERCETLIICNANPMFDSLRTDPRFTDLLRRIGLPTSQAEP